MTRLTTHDLNRALLARQLLLERAPLAPAEAIRRLAGMQAQEPAPPFVGLWTRLEGFQREDLLAALEDRSVVRAALQRATLHLLGADDYVALRAALQPALDGAMRVLGARAAGLDLAALLPAARELLADGPLTFNELRPLLHERFPAVDERALGYAVRTNLPLVMEATGDPWGYPRTARFTLAESWIGGVDAAADEALALAPPSDDAASELVRRYLGAFGPASVADFQGWSGVPGASDTFERLRPELLTFEDDRGRELFDLPDAPRPPADTPAPVRLIPEFDNLVLGHADRRRIISDDHRPGLVTKNLRVRAVYLVDGFVAGTWSVARTKTKAVLTLQPFERTTKTALKPVVAEAERLLAFTDPAAKTQAVETGPPA